MLLEAAFPSAVRAGGENVNVIVQQARAAGILCAPHAVDVLAFVEPDLTVHRLELAEGMNVEHERAAGRDEQVQAAEGLAHLARVGEVIEAVEAADRRLHRAVEVQLGHGLVQKQRRDAGERLCLLARLEQHILRAVHADEFVAAFGEEGGHRAGAAGEVEHGVDRNVTAQEELFDEGGALFVADVLRQLVVGGGEGGIAFHHFSPFMRAKMRS